MTNIEKALALINTFATGDTEKAVSLWQQALDRASEKSEIKDDRRQVLIRKIKLKKYIKE